MNARRPWALPLVPLYALALQLKDRLRPAPKNLTWPVISVGSLSAGGAGKTPVVIALAAMLQQRGWQVDILSRGYGRATSGVQRVDPTRPTAATDFGDEPTLLATRTQAPVYVAPDRHAAGLAAEAAVTPPEGRHVHLLDDAFQHRQLARTLDIVLITPEDLDDALLPAGNRREPLTALRRANILLLREAPEPALDKLQARLKPYLRPDTLIWTHRRTLTFPGRLSSESCLGLNVFGAGLRPIAFCAIARPEAFAQMLIDSGCGIAETVFFPDHHRYTPADIDHILKIAASLKATGLVTTEKDAVKLTPALRARIETLGPLMIAQLDAEFIFPERVARELEARLEPKDEPKPARLA